MRMRRIAVSATRPGFAALPLATGSAQYYAKNCYPPLFYRSRTGRDHPAHFRGNRPAQAAARHHRQPVGNPAIGAELVALPPPDPRAKALFCAKPIDRDPARRSDLGEPGPRRPQHHPSRPALAGLRRRAAAPADYQMPRSELRGGYHDFTIVGGGVRVFPRLVAAERRHPFTGQIERRGIAELDALLGGGLAQGSSTLVIGLAGTARRCCCCTTYAPRSPAASAPRSLPLTKSSGC